MATASVQHGRRRSAEYEDIPTLSSEPVLNTPPTPSSPPQRNRVQSNPSPSDYPAVQSAGPYRTSFTVPNGHGHNRTGSVSSTYSNGYPRGSVSSSSGRQSFSSGIVPNGAHARSPSQSSEFSNPALRSSFAFSGVNDMSTWKTSISNSVPSSPPPPSASSAAQANAASSRRHSRIHSRNLSIFFPRPGATTVHSIAEDGAQEIEAPVTDIPSGSHTPYSAYSSKPTPPSAPARSQLGGGFKFGGRPPPSTISTTSTGSSSKDHLPSIDMTLDSSSASEDNQPSSVPMSKVNTPVTQTSSRRGHHHRHSLSHSFFSFMEPQSPGVVSSPVPGHARRQSNLSLSVSSPNPNATLAAPPLTVNGWGPISPFSSASTAFPPAQLIPPKRTVSFQPSTLPTPSTQRSSSLINKILALPSHMRHGLLFGMVEGCIGCGLWVLGQHSESLAVSGLAYWVCFDAIGVMLGVYGKLIDEGVGVGSLRLPYGAKRIEGVALFAQSVYLLFSAVYICKETIEHALLSAGDAGHHHHHEVGGAGALNTGLTYPITFLWLSFIALSLSSTLLKSNIKLLDATGLFLPSIRQALRSFSSSNSNTFTSSSTRPSSSLLLTNPYTLFPLVVTSLLLSTTLLPLDQEAQRTTDMFIAGLLAAGTAWLSWPACLTLGKVLLQMAPERSEGPERLTEKGTMEALLRAMKEIERHPQVLHLPAPHVWQISPPSTYFSTISSAFDGKVKSEVNGFANGNGHARSYSVSANAQHLRRRSTGKLGGMVVVTLELHVGKGLEDVECLELTRWAWQRCINALGQGEEGVSVGIVRG